MCIVNDRGDNYWKYQWLAAKSNEPHSRIPRRTGVWRFGQILLAPPYRTGDVRTVRSAAAALARQTRRDACALRDALHRPWPSVRAGIAVSVW